jgi:hypothetical protein
VSFYVDPCGGSEHAGLQQFDLLAVRAFAESLGAVDRFDPSVKAPGDPFVTQPLTGSPRFFTATMGAGRAILYRLRTA